MRWPWWFSGSRSSVRSFSSIRQRGQRQLDLSFMTGLQAFGSTVTERGTSSAVWAFRGDAGDGILRVHIVSRNVPRVLRFRSLAGTPAKTVPQRTKKGPPGEAGRPFGWPQLVRNLVRPFGRLPRSNGSSRFRLWFAAIELAHDVGANGPRGDLGRRRFLALAIRPLVG